jgi:sugar lactone lactonase YvrE
MNPPSPSDKLSRRRFFEFGVSGVAAASALNLAPAPHAASAGANPFALDLDRHWKVDPKLVRYERVGRFRCPQPEPRRIALGSEGRLYVAAGKYVAILERNGTPAGDIACPGAPRAVALADDQLYLASKSQVAIYNREGQRQAEWESPPGKPFLTGIAVGKNDVFVADAGNRVVLRYDRSGRLIGRIGEKNKERNIPGFVVPSPYLDVEIAPDGLLRVNNPGRHRVETYTFDGDLEGFWGQPSMAIEGFCGCCNPVGLEMLPDGRCVTFEKGLPRVKIYGADGAFECVVAGPDAFVDTGKEKAVMDRDVGAHGLDGVVDTDGRLYVLDLVAGDIQVMQRKANG